jgi:C2 domain
LILKTVLYVIPRNYKSQVSRCSFKSMHKNCNSLPCKLHIHVGGLIPKLLTASGGITGLPLMIFSIMAIREINSEPKANGQVESDSGAQGGNTKRKVHNLTLEKVTGVKERLTVKKEKAKKKANPPGGHDDTPIPSAPDGYTVRFAFHRAINLPISDIGTRSSDPYIHATLTAFSLQKRHKEDPDMAFRTKTIHRSTDPEWNEQWVVSGVPSSGFKLECRLYDEDRADRDDRLGSVTVEVRNISTSWPGVKEQTFYIKKRTGSKRAYTLRGCAAMLSRNVQMSGKLVLSAEVLGKSDPPYGRMYTAGPVTWTRHFSPVIGRLVGTKNPEENDGERGKAERYE